MLNSNAQLENETRSQVCRIWDRPAHLRFQVVSIQMTWAFSFPHHSVQSHRHDPGGPQLRELMQNKTEHSRKWSVFYASIKKVANRPYSEPSTEAL